VTGVTVRPETESARKGSQPYKGGRPSGLVWVRPSRRLGGGFPEMTRRNVAETRRRKRVVLLALLALLLLVSPLFALSLTGPRDAKPPVRVVVAPGDTLWALASRYGPPNADLRRVVDDTREINHLDGSLIRPGQVLLIETE
jgi:hypothetical protein